MLSDELKRLRKQRGYTQEQFGEFFGLSQATIASWENGTRQPTTDILPQLADFFGVTTDALLGVNHSSAQTQPEAPKTIEARIVSFGMDQLPQEERVKIINILQAMYTNKPELFKRGETNET